MICLFSFLITNIHDFRFVCLQISLKTVGTGSEMAFHSYKLSEGLSFLMCSIIIKKSVVACFCWCAYRPSPKIMFFIKEKKIFIYKLRRRL